MRRKTVAFGMNSMFAVRQFLPEILAMAGARGFRVVVIAPAEAPSLRDTGAAFPGVEFRFVSLQREISPLADLFGVFQLWRVLRIVRPDITDMSTPKMGLLGGMAAWLAGVPERIYTLRGLRYETARSWKRALLIQCERVACRCAQRVICISRSVQETVLEDRIAPPGKTVLLGEKVSEGIGLRPNGVPANVSVAGLRERLKIPHGAQVIGFVGRLTRDKGVPELARAFRRLREDGRDVYLLLVGEFESGDPVAGPVVEWLRASPHVRLTGHTADPAPYYRLIDVFVFPTHREGLGRVLLEAGAAGKPVVSTYATGVVDIVVDGVTGFLVPKGDVEALARATARLLADPELAGRMGRSAMALVRQQFDNSIYLNRLGNMLDSLARQEVGVGSA